jgi:pSer/pThr/pTyr-binding forkhead associated (FHA) protein
VGREQDSNDIALNNQTVSRNHARLDWRNDRWVCTDLESVNGTNVSGVRLKAGVETPITDGAEVLFGDVKLAFEAKVDEKALSSMLLLKKSAKPFIKEELKEDKPKSISSLAEEIKPSELPKEIGAVEVAQKEASAAEMIYEEEAVSSESDIVPVGEAESPPVKKVEEPQPLVESQKVEVKSEATQFFQTSFPTRLKILSGAKMGQTIMLVNLPITIGRATAAGVQGLDDPLVSRQHLDVLLMPDGSIGVKDRGSVNGTYLNGDQLQANQIAAINKGDELRLGSVVLKVE